MSICVVRPMRAHGMRAGAGAFLRRHGRAALAGVPGCGATTAAAMAVGMMAATMAATAAKAQVVLPPLVPTAPPWSALQVFEPLPYPWFWDPLRREGVALEDTPVKVREHPGYESVGVRTGPWMLYPSLAVGALYDSNVFASPSAPQSDIALQVSPRLRVQSLWDRHEVALDASVRSDFYRDHPGLDQTDASFKGRGRIDISHDSAILTTFRAAALNETVGSVSAPTNAAEPTPYSLFSGDITYWQRFNRLAASVGVRADAYDYGSTRAQNGSIINQDSRDGQIYAGHGRLDYVFSPKFGVFTAFEGNRREVRGTPVQPLGSDGYRTLSGVFVEFTPLITGEFAAGYSHQQFDAATVATGAGPAYRALLTWSPTRLIDIRFRAEQLTTYATETDANAVKADSVQLTADYEFRRNVVVSLGGAYERDRFIGVDRRDNVVASLAELKYLLNRYGALTVRHRYIQRDSSLLPLSYDKHEFSINVTAKF